MEVASEAAPGKKGKEEDKKVQDPQTEIVGLKKSPLNLVLGTPGEHCPTSLSMFTFCLSFSPSRSNIHDLPFIDHIHTTYSVCVCVRACVFSTYGNPEAIINCSHYDFLTLSSQQLVGGHAGILHEACV